jgi:hypothetical protein
LIPAALIMFGVVVFSGWWDVKRADFDALPVAPGRWQLVRRVLPAGCVLTGTLMVAGNLWRIIEGREDWFSRYVMGAYWAIAGCIAIGHGVMRVRASRRARSWEAAAS